MATRPITQVELHSLEIRPTLARTQALVRRNWAWVLLLTLCFGIGPSIGWRWLPLSGYRSGSGDLERFSVYAVKEIGFSLVAFVWPVAVTAACLFPSRTVPVKPVWIALKALPALAPIWLLQSLDLAYVLWAQWMDWPRSALRSARADLGSRADLLEFLVLGRLLADLALGCAMTLALGIVVAVAVAERRAGLSLLRRTWRSLAGNRGKVLGLNLLCGSIGFVPSNILSFVTPMLRHSRIDPTVLSTLQWTVLTLERIADGLWAVAVAAIFIELLRLRDGVIFGDIGHVFA
jgi:hypothetical protein